MNHIIRFIHSIEQPFQVLKVDDNGVVDEVVWLDELSQLNQLPEAKQTIVLLSGQDVRLLSVDLPKMNASELQEAIPYALEDQIAEDVDDMLFVKGDSVVDGPTVVAAINREHFMACYSALKHLGINITTLLPDSLAVHWRPAHWSVVFTEDSVLWRFSKQLGISFDRELFTTCWPMIIKQHEALLPECIDVYGNESNNGDNFVNLPQGIRVAWHDQEHWLDAVSLMQEPAFNLLRGKFKLHTRIAKLKKRWLQCAGLAVVCLCLVYGMNLSSYYYMRHQNKAVLATIDQLMTAAGVDASQGPSQARSLMTAEISHYKKLRSANVWVEMLQMIGPIIQQDPHWQLEALDFSKDRLTLTLQEIGTASIQQIMSQLQQVGLQVKQLSGRNNKSQVTLLVTRAEGAV